MSDDGRVADDRQQLRTTFDSSADLYQQARPDYPGPLYDTLVQAAGLKVGDRLLEIGCATGKATIPLARRGFRITCLEIGAALAAAGRRNLADFPHVEIIESAFETWTPEPREQFDLVFAATAWHWLDPATRYQQAWELLRSGGHLAFWSATHVLPDNGDPFFSEIQDVYDEIGEGLPPGARLRRPGELPDDHEEIESSGLFEIAVVRHFDWQISYDADEYLRLLDTFSGHIAHRVDTSPGS
ncbi:MAG: class I SAM-dependent methyltransferase [Actinobacteria bacterium]|nr:class I SAM-dependent methyltransferase [Actinomycetota bacterium]